MAALTPELRALVHERGLMRQLSHLGPGQIRLAGPTLAVPIVVEALSRGDRPDLALALIAGQAAAAGAAALAAVLARHGDLVRPDRAIAAMQVVPSIAPLRTDLGSLCSALVEARARATLGFPAVLHNDWSDQVTALAADSADLTAVLAAADAGDRVSRGRLPGMLTARFEDGVLVEGFLTAAGVRPTPTADVDPVLTWQLCRALEPLDRLLAISIANALCESVTAGLARGVITPQALTANGLPLGVGDAPGTAAAVLLLSAGLLGGAPLETTPPVRGTSLDEDLFLAPVRLLPPGTVLAPGVTAEGLLDEHRRPEREGVRHTSAVRYGESDGQPLLLHLFQPTLAATPAPVVVFVHGGGWESGSPAKFLRQAADWAAEGWVTLSIGYRLTPLAVWPAPLDDLRAALRWVADQAVEIGADPGRVALVGNSAGGQLVLLAGSEEHQGLTVRAVVALSPMTDLRWPGMIPDGKRIVRRLVDGEENLLSSASPAVHVHAGTPPVLTFTGELDELTTPEMVGDYHQLLDEVGVINELHVLPGRWHAFEFAPTDSRLWSDQARQWISGQWERT